MSDRDDIESEVEEESSDGRAGRWPVDRLKPVLEAVIFASGDPLPNRKIRTLIKGVAAEEIEAAAEVLQKEYANRGFRLTKVAGGWQLRTAPEHHGYVKQMFKERPFRLTKAALETVSIIAYRQPATKAEVESIRGVDCSGVLDSLLDREVIRVVGRRDVPGRPMVYATTPKFLEVFGLPDLKALPSLPEMGDDVVRLADQVGYEAGSADAAVLPLQDGDTEISDAETDESPEEGARQEGSEKEFSGEEVTGDTIGEDKGGSTAEESSGREQAEHPSNPEIRH